MSGYIRSILVASAVFSVLNAVIPARKNGFAPYLKYVMALVIILIAASPLASLARNFEKMAGDLTGLFAGSGEADAGDSSSALLRETAIHVSDAVADVLSEQYGLDRNGLRIDVELDESNPGAVRITSVRVSAGTLPPLLTAAYLSSYLSKLIGCPVTVT